VRIGYSCFDLRLQISDCRLRVSSSSDNKPEKSRSSLSYGSAQHVQELIDARFLLLRRFALLTEEAGVEFLGEKGILKTFHRPAQYGQDHYKIHVFAQFAAWQAKAHKSNVAVRILGQKKAIDLTLERQFGAVVSEQRDPVGNPVLAHQMLGADEPIAQNLKKSLLLYVRRCVQVCGKGAHGAFVNFKKKPVLGSEVLKD